MSQRRECDECHRLEERIFGAQPSDQRWLSIKRAYWWSGEVAVIDLCSWACVAAFAAHAQGTIDQQEAGKVPYRPA